MEPILEVKNLKIQFKTDDNYIQAVDGVDLKINQGELLGLVGESGSGKSVTSLAIMGLLPENGSASGTIKFKGEDLLTKKNLNELRGKEISMIFQDPMTSLNPVLTIGEQIEEVIKQHQGGSKKEIRDKAVEILKIVKIPDAEKRMSEYPHQMSGGIRQRIMIGISLACNPALLIADEPTTALDVTVQAQILALIKDLQDKLQAAVLLITHDLGVVAQVADKIAVMYAGQIVEYSSAEELFAAPKHPYTQGLLETIPSIDKKETELKEIKGIVPDLSEKFTGCRFYPRCPQMFGKCTFTNPQLIDNGNSQVRCLLYQDKEVI